MIILWLKRLLYEIFNVKTRGITTVSVSILKTIRVIYLLLPHINTYYVKTSIPKSGDSKLVII